MPALSIELKTKYRAWPGNMLAPLKMCADNWGYIEFLDAIRNPDAPQHDEPLEWAGGKFEYQAFGLDAVNK